MISAKPGQTVLVFIAAVFTIILCLQYPLSATFPIGGDATRYILTGREVIKTAYAEPWHALSKLSNSTYPATIIITMAAELVPIAWPVKWILLVASAHLATAAALFYVIQKTSNNTIAASAAAAAWAIVGLSFTRHIEDGTLAQLLSLPVLVLFLGSILLQKYRLAIGLGILMYFLHPLTGLMAAPVATLTVLTHWQYFWRSISGRAMAAAGVLLALLAVVIFYSNYAHVFSTEFVGDENISPADFRHSVFAPLIVMAIPGIVVLFKKYRWQSLPWLVTGFISCIFIFQSQIMGGSFFFWRLTSYPALFLVLFASFGVHGLREYIPSPRWALTGGLVVLFISMGLTTWATQAKMYRFYESGGNYARLHPDEHTAIRWLQDNTDINALIVSTRANRHSEWIPILSQRNWHGLTSDDPFFTADVPTLKTLIATQGYTHAIVFRHREAASDLLRVETPPQAIAFQNKGAVVIKLDAL